MPSWLTDLFARYGYFVVFFGVLLVGFAYLWKRGDIDWVKTVAAERLAEPSQPAAVLPKPTPAGTLVSAGQP